MSNSRYIYLFLHLYMYDRLTRVAQDARCFISLANAIELVHSTLVAQDPRRFMALGVIEGNRTRPFDSGGTGSQALHGLGCNRTRDLTRVARDPRRFMALGTIEGNRTRPFYSAGAGSKALYGFGCDRRQSTSPVRLSWRRIQDTSWPYV